MRMHLETYSSAKPVNLVKSKGIPPVKFFADNLLVGTKGKKEVAKVLSN